MKHSEPGYAYILTNPSFRKDWEKIGKNAGSVDVRSKELDNTASLLFEIFGTMKKATNQEFIKAPNSSLSTGNLHNPSSRKREQVKCLNKTLL